MYVIFRTKRQSRFVRRRLGTRCRRYCTCSDQKENPNRMGILNFRINGKGKKKIERIVEKETKRDLTD